MNDIQTHLKSVLENRLHRPICKHHKCNIRFGKAAFGLGLLAGATYGLLFAKTSGQELRTKLRKSETPMLDFWRATEETKLEVIDFLKEKCRECKAKWQK